MLLKSGEALVWNKPRVLVEHSDGRNKRSRHVGIRRDDGGRGGPAVEVRGAVPLLLGRGGGQGAPRGESGWILSSSFACLPVRNMLSLTVHLFRVLLNSSVSGFQCFRCGCDNARLIDIPNGNFALARSCFNLCSRRPAMNQTRIATARR